MTLTRHTGIGAFLLGMGIIAMLDGILFHQLLQWHSTVMQTDRFHQIQSDGYLHLLATMLLFAGAWVLWRSDYRRGSEAMFWGGLLMGAGFFNLAEGLLNHHILGLHHVRPGWNEPVWDVAYDLTAVGLIFVGWSVLAARRKDRAY
ncbi:DUF2243 domain-containing protein [Gorillibacterium sp. sgz5001074]|uniref:DUF2243 domain-containing protein n=1 Tax=Gorillibacterium sp. sgz5001074 TaxID=3446695 RepID=UPI003F672D34